MNQIFRKTYLVLIIVYVTALNLINAVNHASSSVVLLNRINEVNDNNHNASNTISSLINENNNEYFNICMEISSPFIIKMHKGSDIKLIRIISKRLLEHIPSEHLQINMKQFRIQSADSSSSRNHTTHQVDAEFNEELKQCDLIFPSVINTEKLLTAIKNVPDKLSLIGSDYYHIDRLLLCSAKRRYKDDWKKLRTITTTQLMMVLPFGIYVAITYYISRKMIHKDKFQNLEVIFWSYFRVISSVPNDAQHQPQSRTLRFLYTAWLLFCFILTINYNTLILRVFKNELFIPQILNVDQAIKEHFQLYTLNAFSPAMNYPYVHDCRTVDECFNMLRTNENRNTIETGRQHRNDANGETVEGKGAHGKKTSDTPDGHKLMIALPATIVEFHRKDFMELGEETIYCFEHVSAVYRRQIFAKSKYRDNYTYLESNDGGSDGRKQQPDEQTWNIRRLNKLLKSINRSGIYKYWLKKLMKPNLQVQRNFHKNTNSIQIRNQLDNNEQTNANLSEDQKANTKSNQRKGTGMLQRKSIIRNPFVNSNGNLNESGHAIGVLVYKDFAVLYAYLFIGVITSTVGFIAEHVYYYYKHNKCYLHNK